MWKESNLNTVNLNDTFYNKMIESYKEMIEEHEWQVGGFGAHGTAKTIYNLELGIGKLTEQDERCYNQGNNSTSAKRLCNGDKDITYPGYVGLMYVSDYMYGATNKSWITTTNNYSAVKDNNWLYMGLEEWFISRGTNTGNSAWVVTRAGLVYDDNYALYVYGGSRGVRPALYLESSVKIISGSGTSGDPYKLSM